MLHYQEATCEWSLMPLSGIQCQVFNLHNIYYVISKEQPVSGGAEFPIYALMSVMVRARVRVNPNSNPNPYPFVLGKNPF